MSVSDTVGWQQLPPDSVLVETAAGPRLFRDPDRILVARSPAEIPAALVELDGAVADGFFTAGFFSYDDGRDLFERPVPLLWFGCYKSWVPFTYATFQDSFSLRRLETVEDERRARSEFLNATESIRTGIQSGLYYQVNYTQRERFDFKGSPFALFRRLRELQKGRYAAFVSTESIKLLSLSPELFFSIEPEGTSTLQEPQSRVIRAHPMKGTAGRDFDPSALAGDEKSRAENFMIVDLMRNDIGRIAKIGSVAVEALAKVEQLSTVQQMISIVRGELDGSGGFSELYGSLFPPGSVTGAPKRAATRTIEKLEPSRGVYTGAIGYAEPGLRKAAFNVAIRTLQIQDQRAVYGSGCGIVWDSKPELEWNEYLLKKAFLRPAEEDFHLIETMRLDKGRIELLSGHLERLKRSAREFAMELPERAILEAVQIHVEQARERMREQSKDPLVSTPAQRVRLALYQHGRFEIQVQPAPDNLDSGVRLLISSESIDSQDVFRRHKSSQRQSYDAELKRARELGFDDVLFRNEKGEFVETAIGNILILVDGVYYSPPVESGALPGVFLESLGKKNQLKRRAIGRAELETGFVSNALRGLRRIASISE